MTQHLISTEGWRDMSSAPRDGTWIILFSKRAEPTVSVGYWDTEPFLPDDDEPWGWSFMEADGMPSHLDPTHWMPLPTPPAGEQA